MPADPDAAPEAVERMVTAPCPRCGTIHLWDQDPRAADAAEVERLRKAEAEINFAANLAKSFADQAERLKAENARLRTFLRRAFLILNEMAGEGIAMSDQEDPADVLCAYAEAVGHDADFDDMIAALGGAS